MLAHDGADGRASTIHAPAESSVDVPIAWKTASSGSIAATVDDPDGFPADNSRYLVLEALGRTAVLVVASGDASGFFLLRALEAAAALDPRRARSPHPRSPAGAPGRRGTGARSSCSRRAASIARRATRSCRSCATAAGC